MKNLVLFILVGSSFLSCKTDKKEIIKELSWIKGSWTATVEGNIVNETWSLKNDSTWYGESAFMRNGEPLFTETMSISVKEGKFHFITAISDQNGGDDIVFTQKDRSENKVTFENPEHDFPQMITYEKTGENSMLAYISGKLDGKAHRIDFKFSRIK